MTRFSILLFTAALATACARTEPADPTPGEDLNVSQAGPAEDQPGDVDPTTAGSWEASAQGQSQSVAFRAPQGETLFTISCDLRGGLVVQRPGLIARGNLALMQLRTADAVRRYAVSAGAGQQPQVEARIPYNDQIIGALLSFDEPLEVRYEGVETLNLPPNPIVSDLVRTCQQSNAAPATPAEGNDVQAQGNSAAAQPAPPTQNQQ